MTNQVLTREKNYNVFSIVKAIFEQREAKGQIRFKATEKSQFIYSYALLNANTYKDMKKGGRYLKRCARKNDQDALLLLARNYYYGYGVKRSEKNAYKTWRKCARLGNAESIYYYGLCFAKGIHTGVNLKKAEKQLKIALYKGFSLAEIAINDLKYV